jgi:hypothetical protein
LSKPQGSERRLWFRESALLRQALVPANAEAAPVPTPAQAPAWTGGAIRLLLGRLRCAVGGEQLWCSPSIPIFGVNRVRSGRGSCDAPLLAAADALPAVRGV